MTGNTERIPLAESNFLVPNGTFFVELIAFGIIVSAFSASSSSRPSTGP